MDPRTGSDHGIVLCVGLAPGHVREVAQTVRDRALVVAAADVEAALAAAGLRRDDVAAVLPAASRGTWPAGDWYSAPQSRGRGEATGVVVGPLRIDLAAHEATIDGIPVRLSLQEFDLLVALASDVGRVWSFADLTARVWRTGYRGDRDPVNSAVKRLRKRLTARPGVEIASVRGVGYRLRITH